MENKGSSADSLIDGIVRNAVSMDKVWATNHDNHQPLVDGIVGNSSPIRTVVDEILATSIPRPTEQELGIFPSEPVSLPPLKPIEYKNLHTGKTTNLETYLLAGGNINGKNSEGQTPIEVAVAVGSPQDVRVILEAPGFDPRGIDVTGLARIQKLYGDVQDYKALEPLLEKFEAMKAAIEADPAQIKGPVSTIPADFDPRAAMLNIPSIQEMAGSTGIKFQQDSINSWMALDNPAPAVRAPDEPSL